ncbi:protein FAM122A [Microcaecilia unicolor]|uniref:Protein FAM122A-like n=1 Tax=Microcaecilia unicolor TaxID=1415580 RepID=A0A6P7X042_9AMPH|nr:protein FAM122A-like [Microcaecilia unicolor]
MERMEVDQCACAAPGGGGASLRRSNSAPMITHLSDSSLLFQSCGNRCRRSSVSVNLGCPGLSFPLSPFQMSASHMDSPCMLQGDGSDTFPRSRPYSREAPAALESSGAWPESCHTPPSGYKIGITPSSSPRSLQRFPRSHVTLGVSLPALGSLKRKGGVEVDSPPKKLFIAGVPGPENRDFPVINSPMPPSCSGTSSLGRISHQ